MICLKADCERRGKGMGTLGGIKLSYCLRHEYIFSDLEERNEKAVVSMTKIRADRAEFGRT